jgi:hypothetical protein
MNVLYKLIRALSKPWKYFLHRLRACSIISAMDKEKSWKEIVAEILDTGLTQVEVAARCNTTQGHVSSMLRGIKRHPSWELGDKLLSLHRRIVKRRRKAAS